MLTQSENNECVINRFRQEVTISIGEGKTIYLPEKIALDIARQLALCCQDMQENNYQNSKFNTILIEV